MNDDYTAPTVSYTSLAIWRLNAAPQQLSQHHEPWSGSQSGLSHRELIKGEADEEGVASGVFILEPYHTVSIYLGPYWPSPNARVRSPWKPTIGPMASIL